MFLLTESDNNLVEKKDYKPITEVANLADDTNVQFARLNAKDFATRAVYWVIIFGRIEDLKRPISPTLANRLLDARGHNG